VNKSLPVFLMHLCVSALLAAAVSYGGYVMLCDALETAQEEHSQAYIRVRAEREQQLFDDAQVFVRTAESAFRRRLAVLDNADVSAEFERFFPLMPDGTRRSVPELFEGQTFPDGDHVYGVGSFLADGADMTLADKRLFLAAFQTVRSVGEAHINRFSSLYFFTPDRRVVIFAPGREDRLEFYRITAPADFDLRGDEDAALFDRATNPNGEMQCSRLSRFVYTDGGERSATSCRLPIRRDGELLGGIGTSIMMTAHLERALRQPPPYGVNMLFDAEGNVIVRGDVFHAGQYVDPEADRIDPNTAMEMLRDDPRPSGVIQAPDSPYLIAYSRLDGPSWYFVSFIPLDVVWTKAANWARVVFVLTFLASLIFISIRWGLSRRRFLRRLKCWQALVRRGRRESARAGGVPRRISRDAISHAE
jgi:hypothetical protein